MKYTVALLGFAVLTELCLSLRFPKQYLFLYYGRLTLQIPEINDQKSAVGFLSFVVLQMKTKTRGVGQIIGSSVCNRTFDQNEFSCRVRSEDFDDLHLYRDEFEKPFAFDIDENKNNLVVAEGEKEFITNIRKSILEMVRADNLISQMEDAKKKGHNQFYIVQKTGFGRCRVYYTFGPAHVLSNNRPNKDNVEEYLAKNIHKTNIKSRYRLGDEPQLWLNKTGIDFDSCEDRVVLQRSSLGTIEREGGQNLFLSFQSRESTGAFLLCFHNGYFQPCFVEVNEKIDANPFGFETQKLQSRSTKWLLLVDMVKINKTIVLPQKTQKVKTSMYEVASSFPPAAEQKKWINSYSQTNKTFPIPESYLTGISASELISEHKKEHISPLSLIDEVVNDLMQDSSSKENSKSSWVSPTPWSPEEAIDSISLLEVIKILQSLSKEDIKDLFRKTAGPRNLQEEFRRMLLTDAVAATGTCGAIRALLQEMKSGRVSDWRMATVWATMANHLISPAVVKDLMSFVTSMKTENVLLSSMVHVNFAAVANKFCINPLSNLTVERDLYGSEACRASEILKEFIPYMEGKLQASSSSNETAYLIQTLSNLGCEAAMETLADVANNRNHSNRLRTLAIFALEKKKIGEQLGEQVFGKMMALFEDRSENDEIRQSAFIILLTWQPDATWWHRVAHATWDETSENIAAFVTFTIKAIAETTSPSLHQQAAIASLVVPRTKPVPASLSHSYNFVYAKFLQYERIDTRFHFEWLPNSVSLLPQQIYAHLSATVGGLDFNLFEIAMASYGYDHFLQIPQSEKSYYSFAGAESDCDPPFRLQTLVEMYKHNVEKLPEPKEKPTVPDFQSNILLRFLDNIYAFLPFDHFGKPQYNIKKKDNFVKFFIPFSSEIYLPTEVGIPIVFQTSLSVLINMKYSIEISYQNDVSVNQNDVPVNQANLIHDVRVFGKLFSRIKGFFPPSGQTAIVGVDNVKIATFPFNTTVSAHESASKDSKHEGQPSTGFTVLRMETLAREQFPAFYAHNIPFAAVKPLFSAKKLPEATDLKVILSDGAKPLENVEVDLSVRYPNLSLSLNYTGDVSLPFTSANLMDFFREPQKFVKLLASPTARLWKFSLNYNPATSAATAMELSLDNEIINIVEDIETAIKEDVKHFIKIKPLSTDVKANNHHRHGKITFYNPNMVLPCLWAVFGIYSDQKQAPLMRNKTTGMFVFGSNEGNFQFAYRYLLNEQLPNVTTMEELKSFIQFDNKAHVELRVEDIILKEMGLAKYAPYVEMKGSMGLSEKMKNRLISDLNDQCFGDEQSVITDLYTCLSFDEANMNVTYSPEMFSVHVLNMTYGILNLAKGSYFPFFQSNQMDVSNDENVIHFNAKRLLPDSDTFHLRVERPHDNIIISDFRLPLRLDKIISYSDLLSAKTKDSSLSSSYHSKAKTVCQITSQFTKTFDGRTIRFPLTSCPTIEAVDVANLFSWLLLARYNDRQQPEVTILSFSRCITVVASPDTVKVNDKVVHLKKDKPMKLWDWYGYTVFELRSNGSKITIDFLHFLSAEIENRSIRIVPEARMRGLYRGMCGDFDGIPENDMTGPKLCIYDDPGMFGASWLMPTFDKRCKKLTWIHDLEVKANLYQKFCPKRPS